MDITPTRNKNKKLNNRNIQNNQAFFRKYNTTFVPTGVDIPVRPYYPLEIVPKNDPAKVLESLQNNDNN